jgi:hypothetical protein
MPLFKRNADKNNDKDKEKKVPAPEEVPETAPEAEDETPAPEVPAADSAVTAQAQAPEAAIPAPEAAEDPAPAKPRYHTPDGFEFNRYFLAERHIMLENVSYETPQRVQPGQLRLNARDTIVAQLIGSAGVKITYNRTLSFDPEGPFTLSVSFSVMLVFNPGTRGEVDWKTIDMAEEFKKNCPQLVQAMMTKTTLLVAEITNANGAPILPILPLGHR